LKAVAEVAIKSTQPCLLVQQYKQSPTQVAFIATSAVLFYGRSLTVQYSKSHPPINSITRINFSASPKNKKERLEVIINKTLYKDKPPTLLQGYTEFCKKNLHTEKGSIFFAKTLQFSQRTACWLHKVSLMNNIFYAMRFFALLGNYC
jgi:hypothetical protein